MLNHWIVLFAKKSSCRFGLSPLVCLDDCCKNWRVGWLASAFSPSAVTSSNEKKRPWRERKRFAMGGSTISRRLLMPDLRCRCHLEGAENGANWKDDGSLFFPAGEAWKMHVKVETRIGGGERCLLLVCEMESYQFAVLRVFRRESFWNGPHFPYANKASFALRDFRFYCCCYLGPVRPFLPVTPWIILPAVTQRGSAKSRSESPISGNHEEVPLPSRSLCGRTQAMGMVGQRHILLLSFGIISDVPVIRPK